MRLNHSPPDSKNRQLSHGYEGRDNLPSITDALTPANSETFGYTPREHLTSASGPYGSLAFTYDGVGNRLTASVGAVTDSYSYPATSNRLSAITLGLGGSRGFGYDGAGNVVTDNRGGTLYGYTYNAAGRMSALSVGGVPTATYTYDAMGRQAIRTLVPSGLTIHSVFDSEGRRIAEYNEATGALIREYVWNGWDPVAVIEGGVVYLVRADHIGRPAFATTLAGTKVWSAVYLPFGGVHVSVGAPIEARFPGQWFQSESGLHQNWMRDYDPTTGRYLQADPLGLVDGASVYGYALQSPLVLMDPEGLEAVTIGGIIIGTGVRWIIKKIIGEAVKTVGPIVYAKLTRDQEKEKSAEYKAYNTVCQRPIPPSGDKCADLIKQLYRARMCAKLRKQYSEKWYGGADHGHATETANWVQRIRNLTSRLENECEGCIQPELLSEVMRDTLEE